ncbi:hypothetical protein ACFL13_03210, partial [Patescibacteria group bacterium]
MLKLLFIAIVTALSFGQFSVLGQIGESKVYLFDALIILYVLIGLIYLLGIERKFFVSNYLYPFLLFILVVVISMIANFYRYTPPQVLIAGFYGIRFLFYVLAAIVTHNSIPRELVIKIFMLSGFFVAIGGFIQLAVLPDFTMLDESLGWDPHKNRLASTFFDPNFTGGYLVLCFVLS